MLLQFTIEKESREKVTAQICYTVSALTFSCYR